MRYQPHIDGLRTFAVVPVVLFHIDHALLPGGYIGVDIFFVISGFLITSILYADITAQRYSLLEFYKRRALRILPALAVVLLVTLGLSAWLLFPNEQVETGWSAAAAAGFVSNFYFWSDSGYFSGPAETKPLLHTWSLAVEEQFYIVFPPLLYALVRYFHKHLMAIIGGVVVLSFAACVALTVVHQPTAFYLLPTRAWELGFGALLAIWSIRRGAPEANQWLGLLGLALILVPMVLLDRSSIFPGWWAFFPCAGAVLLIGWGAAGVTGRILSWGPCVWIGKISYSMYLWHWPVIVFWKIHTGADLTPLEMMALGLASVVLGAVSTFVIERPFRGGAARALPPARVTGASAVALIAVAGVGVAHAQGMFNIGTKPAAVIAIAKTEDYRDSADFGRQFRKGTCMIGSDEGSFDVYDKQVCASVKTDAVNILVYGDSHAGMFGGAVRDLYPEANVLQATASGCRPLLETKGAKRCTDMRDWVFGTLLPENDIDLVILSARWRADETDAVTQTVARLAEHSGAVAFFGPTVEYEGVLPKLLARSVWRDAAFDFAATRTPGIAALNTTLSQIVAQTPARYIDVFETLCDGPTCTLFSSTGEPAQFDYGHLTLSAARDVLAAHQTTLSTLAQEAALTR